jgi:hypothetical protein
LATSILPHHREELIQCIDLHPHHWHLQFHRFSNNYVFFRLQVSSGYCSNNKQQTLFSKFWTAYYYYSSCHPPLFELKCRYYHRDQQVTKCRHKNRPISTQSKLGIQDSPFWSGIKTSNRSAQEHKESFGKYQIINFN